MVSSSVIPIIPHKEEANKGIIGYNNRTVYGETGELVYTVTVQNRPKFLLPEAGGKGVHLIMTVGILAMLAGVLAVKKTQR